MSRPMYVVGSLVWALRVVMARSILSAIPVATSPIAQTHFRRGC